MRGQAVRKENPVPSIKLSKRVQRQIKAAKKSADKLAHTAEKIATQAKRAAGKARKAKAKVKALAASPGFLPAALSLAAGLEASGRNDEAVTVLRTVLQHAEPSAEAAATARRELERLSKR